MLLLASSVCELFKWRQFEPEVILLAVGWYLRVSLSSVTWRSCLPACTPLRGGYSACAPENSAPIATAAPPTNDSWRMDETYGRVRANGCTWAAIDFLLSAKRDAVAAKRFLAKALGGATIRRRGSSTPTRTPLTRQTLCDAKTAFLRA
jgi:transposase, IS6 family